MPRRVAGTVRAVAPVEASAAAPLGVWDDVQVWRVGLDDAPAGVAPTAVERERAGRMGDDLIRSRFLASRAWLRVILGRELGINAGVVRYTRSERGKPSVLHGGDLCFSLSRSAGVALVAVTRGRAVGVDVEQIRSDVDDAGLAERFFSPAEAGELRALPETERRAAFFALWVRKEAVVKATGAGLGDGLGHFDARGGRVDDRWSLASLDAGPELAAAVAVDGDIGSVSVQAGSELELEEVGADDDLAVEGGDALSPEGVG
jgi:4'-phosphopantetheinyl transferase